MDSPSIYLPANFLRMVLDGAVVTVESGDWEKPYLEGFEDPVFRNTFKDIRYILEICADNATRFEVECYDIGHLYTAAHFADRGILKPPFMIQSVFGLLGGIGTHADDVMHMRRTAERLFGDQYYWSVLGAGRSQMPMAAMAAAMRGNLRVGPEVSLWDRSPAVIPRIWPPAPAPADLR